MAPDVLVIEEDAALRTLFCEWVAGAGWHVRGRARLGAGVDPYAEVGLVIVDLFNLPTDGAAMVIQVMQRFPRAAVVGVSTQVGRVMSAQALQALAPGLRGLLPKPCTRDELLACVVQALRPANAEAGHE